VRSGLGIWHIPSQIDTGKATVFLHFIKKIYVFDWIKASPPHKRGRMMLIQLHFGVKFSIGFEFGIQFTTMFRVLMVMIGNLGNFFGSNIFKAHGNIGKHRLFFDKIS
jgi:hypothetical protein